MNVGHTRNPGKDEAGYTGPTEVLGPLFDGFYPVLPDGSWDNFLAAFNKRCNYFDGNQAHPIVVQGSLRLLHQVLPWRLPEIHWNLDLFEKWVCKYPPEKQARMRSAIETFSRYSGGEFANKEVFTKVELLLKRHKPDWAGRIVNKSSDLHNALSGPIITECLDRLKKVLECPRSQSFDVSYTLAYKGNEEDMTEKMGVKGTYIECDFSENDMRQCSTVVEIEGMWMTQLGSPAWLVHSHRRANVYRAFSRKHCTSAGIKNQLPSGSTSTTFRNSLWNASIFHTFALKHRLKARVLILGDDMLARILNRLFKRADREYEYICKLARMKSKVKVHKYIASCEFLSRNFMPCDTGSQFVPKLGKALARFNARANNNLGISDQVYMAGKSLSYAYEFRHVEFIAALFLINCQEQGVSLGDIPREALGFNAARCLDDGGVPAILSTLRHAKKVSFDDATQFYHHRYSLTLTEVTLLIEKVLFGDKDIDTEEAFVLAAQDFL